MNTLQIESPKMLTIHTTLFDLLAAMQEAASERQLDTHKTDADIIATVNEWMQSGRITSGHPDPILSAA